MSQIPHVPRQLLSGVSYIDSSGILRSGVPSWEGGNWIYPPAASGGPYPGQSGYVPEVDHPLSGIGIIDLLIGSGPTLFQLGSGAVLSGSTGYTFPICGSISTGEIRSGFLNGTQLFCPSCNLPLFRVSDDDGIVAVHRAIGGIRTEYHLSCTQWTPESGFPTREGWIRDSLPDRVQNMDLPRDILADWLQDNVYNRDKDAEYLRSLNNKEF